MNHRLLIFMALIATFLLGCGEGAAIALFITQHTKAAIWVMNCTTLAMFIVSVTIRSKFGFMTRRACQQSSGPAAWWFGRSKHALFGGHETKAGPDVRNRRKG